MRIELRGLLIVSEAALNTWLNGYEYHRDADNVAKLEEAHDPAPSEPSTSVAPNA